MTGKDGFHAWCLATATMQKCPLIKYCRGEEKPEDMEAFEEEKAELCFEREGEYSIYYRYEIDDPSFYEIPEYYEEPPEPWDEYAPEPEEPEEPFDFLDE